MIAYAGAKATKTARCAKRTEADIGNIREGRDKAARRFSRALAQRISDLGR
jgi:hypothetical protein